MAKSKKVKITAEIMEKVLYLNCEDEDGVRRLKKSLAKLPFIKDSSDLETDELERKIKKLEIRYMIHLAYVMRDIVERKDVYSGMIKMNGGNGNGTWLKTIYGKTMWEVFAKALFFYYYYIEKNRKPKKV